MCCSAYAQTAEELLTDGKNTDNVLNFGMGYDLKMWSPLKQINKSNVKRLVPIWNFSLMNDMGELAQPTIYNGVMYVVNGNWTFAIDVATGRQIWRTPVTYDRAALRVTTGGAYLRGAATIYNGKLFRQNIDGHVAALDMKTGKEIWKTKFGEWKESYGGIVQPTHRQRRADLRHGGRRPHGARLPRRLRSRNRQAPVAHLDRARAGRERLRNLAQRGASGRLEVRRRARPGSPARTIRSSTFSTSAPATPSRTTRSIAAAWTACTRRACLRSGPRPAKWSGTTSSCPTTASISTPRPRTSLPDIQVEGKPRKVLINVNKNGFVYVIDRTNGRLIAAHPFVNQNWAKHIDLKTGRPVLTDLLDRAIKGETIDLAPRLGTNATLSAYNPQDRHALPEFVGADPGHEVRGRGAENRRRATPASKRAPSFRSPPDITSR